MIAARSQPVGRFARVALTLVAVSALISVRAAEQPARPAEGREALCKTFRFKDFNAAFGFRAAHIGSRPSWAHRVDQDIRSR